MCVGDSREWTKKILQTHFAVIVYLCQQLLVPCFIMILLLTSTEMRREFHSTYSGRGGGALVSNRAVFVKKCHAKLHTLLI